MTEGSSVHRLFEDFLDNEEQYHVCERYWEELVASVAESLGQTGEWKREIWRYGDGTLWDLDGNPMFVARSEKRDRYIGILQHPAAADRLQIVAYLKRYEEEYTGVSTRDELVINLGLSEESAQLAEALLLKWMTPGTTVDEMKSFIRESLPPMVCELHDEPYNADGYCEACRAEDEEEQ